MDEKNIAQILHITDLVGRYLKVQLTPGEAHELDAWLKQDAGNRQLFEQLISEERFERIHNDFTKIDVTAALNRTKEKKRLMEPKTVVMPSFWVRLGTWKYAAAVLVILSMSVYFLSQKHAQKPANIIAKNDFQPGGNKAILKLSTGVLVSLTDAKTGVVAQDANLHVKKEADGSISFQSDKTKEGATPAYQTITTPKGGQWPVINLPDGTQVTLDAGSSITYPLAFTANERKVTVTGQAFFNVMHDATRPFRVSVKDLLIEDIGTEFNINAFDDEPAIKTTLVQGRISIDKDKQHVELTPGQQAIGDEHTARLQIRPARLDEVVAWKYGLFHFEHADLQTVMRQICRWYDVEVRYEGEIPKADVSGEVYRSMKASRVFEVLNNLKVKFRVEGRTIIISDDN